MVWTQNRIRSRLSLRRHRPNLEHLDERCLLSTGVTANLHHLAASASAPHAATAHANHAGPLAHAGQPAHTAQSVHAHRLLTRGANLKVALPAAAAPASAPERPAGTLVAGTPTTFDPIIGAATARQQYSVDGTGMTVAVIDTGVDYNNPALGAGYGPNAKVIAGYNFASNSPDPMATGSQHGTAVAGLIGSQAPNDLGVAPGVKIVALRVTDSSNTASLTNIANALQWVINNHSTYHITVVNMSLSDGGNYAQNWFAYDGGVGQQITSLIGQLSSLNIPVVSATGNSFSGQQGEGFTSIISGVISVTATNTSDQLLPDAQRLGPTIGMGTMTDLAAPGQGMTAPTGDNGYSTVEGTSFATPLVSGAVVLLQQIYQARFGSLPTVGQVTQWLEQGSDPIHDPVTGLTIGRLDIPKAAALIPAAHAAQPPTAPPAPAPPPVTVSIPAVQTSTATSTPVSYTPAPTSAAAAATATTTTSTSSSSSTTSSTSTSISTSTTSSTSTSATTASGTQSTPAPTGSTLSSNVKVFVNGQQVSSLNTAPPSAVAFHAPAELRLVAQSHERLGGGQHGCGPGVGEQRQPGTHLERDFPGHQPVARGKDSSCRSPGGEAGGVASPAAPLTAGTRRHRTASPHALQSPGFRAAPRIPHRGGRRGFRFWRSDAWVCSEGRWTLAAALTTALITGAGSGIGRGIARTLDQMGLRLALVGRDLQKLERVRSELAGGRETALALACDVADREAAAAVVRRVLESFGSIDLLVCNAGTNVRNRSLETLAPDDWDRMIAVNLTGPFNLVQNVLPSMRERKNGLVIQICSISGIRASTLGGVGYSASKFGQSALGICLGREEGARGIRSTVIYPGEVNTPILDARPVPVPAERRAAILQPEDIAAAVRFLVELHPRARVPELVITPTVDDFC